MSLFFCHSDRLSIYPRIGQLCQGKWFFCRYITGELTYATLKSIFCPLRGLDGFQKETYTKSRQKYYCHNFCAGMSSFWVACTRFLCRDVFFLKTGKKVTCTIQRNGDLIHRMYLQATQGGINSPLKPPPAAPFSESAIGSCRDVLFRVPKRHIISYNRFNDKTCRYYGGKTSFKCPLNTIMRGGVKCYTVCIITG